MLNFNIMECIFCHKDSSPSKSIEHLIPESLGNKHHVLPTGYVCDECIAKRINHNNMEVENMKNGEEEG